MIKKNILIGVTTLAVIFSTGAAAYAATSTTDGQTGNERTHIMANLTGTQRDAVMQARADSMTEAVAELVDNGSITQDVADKLSKARLIVKDKDGKVLTGKDGQGLTEEKWKALREEEKNVFESKLADLVKEGTFTQDQVDKMKQGPKMMMSSDLTAAQKETLMQAKVDAMKEAAANLLAKGTLTQDEADKIAAAIAAAPKEKPTVKPAEKPAGILTEAQGTALKEAMNTIFKSKLSDLVDKGTITQDQADQLLNDKGAMHMGPGGKHGHGPGGFPGTEKQTSQTI